MTKEEAANHIRYGIIEENYHLPKELGIEVCEMAIKALEQEPCEDCISRDEAIRVAEQGQIQGYEWQFKKLCNLPYVTPQQKTGRWNRVTDKAGHCVWECDKCGWQQRFNTNYCPDCGAKKQEEEENDD